MRVTLLICDAAQEMGGKLYILGGGWSQIRKGGPKSPVNMALAIVVSVPWDLANKNLKIDTKLMDEDGNPVSTPDGRAIGASGGLEVGRPTGIKPGTDLDAPLALTFNGMPLPPGGYRWEIDIDGEQQAIAPFRVLAPK